MSNFAPKDYGLPTSLLNGILQQNPANKDLFLQTNFTISIKRCPSFSYFTQTVSLSELGGDPMEAEYAIGPKVKLPTVAAVFKDFTVKFLVNNDLSNYYEIIKWMREGTPYRDLSEIRPLNEVWSEAFIIVSSNKKKPLLKLTFRGIFPTELSGLEFKATETDTSPLTATVKFTITQTVVETL